MGYTGVACPTCAAPEILWRDGRYVCTYCGGTVVPRLAPGTLCGEGGCLQPAQTLCQRCARPLCDRHNDPKTVYWHAPLMLERIVSDWKADDATAWMQLALPFQRFPVPGVEGLEWIHHERQALRSLGEHERVIEESIRPVVRSAGGHIRDYACRFESLCAPCEQHTSSEIDKRVAAFREEYRRIAFTNRIEAQEADLKQALRYIESFLGRSLPEPPEEAMAAPYFAQLTAEAPPEEWERCGFEVKRRLRLLERFLPRLGG